MAYRFPTTVKEVYTKLGLEHPCDFAERQIRNHLSMIDDGIITNREVMLNRQTGRTTLMLARVYVASCNGEKTALRFNKRSIMRSYKDIFMSMIKKLGMPPGFEFPEFLSINDPVPDNVTCFDDNIISDIEKMELFRGM